MNLVTDLLDKYPAGFELDVTVRPKAPLAKPLLFTLIEVQQQGSNTAVSSALLPITGRDMHVNLTADQQVVLRVAGADRHGNPVEVPGVLAWSNTDDAVARLDDNGDGTRTLVALTEGNTVVTVTDDVEGDGVVEFSGSLSVDVVAGNIAAINLVADAPVAQP